MMTLTAPVATDYMAKKTPPPPPPPDLPSETVRIEGDLMEQIRFICFHSKDARGKRIKIAQYLDNLIRGPVGREYAEIRARVAAEGQS